MIPLSYSINGTPWNCSSMRLMRLEILASYIGLWNGKNRAVNVRCDSVNALIAFWFAHVFR